jgi:hypothetical protein
MSRFRLQIFRGEAPARLEARALLIGAEREDIHGEADRALRHWEMREYHASLGQTHGEILGEGLARQSSERSRPVFKLAQLQLPGCCIGHDLDAIE